MWRLLRMLRTNISLHFTSSWLKAKGGSSLVTTKPVTWPVNQLEHLTMHFRSPAHCLLYPKRHNGPLFKLYSPESVPGEDKFPPHSDMHSALYIWILKLTRSVSQWEESDKWMLTSIWEKKNAVLTKHVYFPWQLFMDKSSPGPARKLWKPLRNGYCPWKEHVVTLE